MSDDDVNCGPCCACGVENSGARNVLMMSFEAPEGFQGWGCLQCKRPMRGAVAIVCDTCLEHHTEPRFILGGRYMADQVRVPLEGYERRPFDHDLSKHPEVS